VNLLEYTKERVRAFLGETDRLAEAEFPYWHSRAVIDQLHVLFQTKLTRLNAFAATSHPSVVAQECRITLIALYQYLPLLGFVLRSTNIRNAFEVFGPFLRMAGDILEPGVDRANRKTKLLLSSEWWYSPLTYRPISDLPNFIFIGLPAPESSNPLLLPLAGHELGHSVWAHYKLAQSFIAKVEDQVVKAIQARFADYQKLFGTGIKPGDLTTNLFARETWRLAAEWCLSQAEESFCDFIGVRIFGASYLHAFAYLLAPSFGTRAIEYPGIETRVQNLVNAASKFGVSHSPSFPNLFDRDALPTLSDADTFRLEIADEALAQLIDELLVEADGRVTNAAIGISADAEVSNVLKRIRQVVPAEGCKTIADILNGAWLAWEDPDLWTQFPGIADRKLSVLKELVLKNLEIFEIEQIQAQP
jgi:hypothetical protein